MRRGKNRLKNIFTVNGNLKQGEEERKKPDYVFYFLLSPPFEIAIYGDYVFVYFPLILLNTSVFIPIVNFCTSNEEDL